VDPHRPRVEIEPVEARLGALHRRARLRGARQALIGSSTTIAVPSASCWKLKLKTRESVRRRTRASSAALIWPGSMFVFGGTRVVFSGASSAGLTSPRRRKISDEVAWPLAFAFFAGGMYASTDWIEWLYLKV